ncbi:MAG: leucine-rich repeat protein [Prevotella sp.]|nr:leucine-rich repeat protein [Prevotella sp.]
MRKTYTLIVMLAMLFVGVNSVSAQTVTLDGLIYTLDGNGNALLSGVEDATQTEISVPASLTYNNGTVKVAGVAEEAFKDNTVLQKVTFAATASSDYLLFNPSCFEDCTNLQAVVLDASQRKCYYSRAFKNCTSLKQIGATANRVQLGSNSYSAISYNADNQEEVFMGCESMTYLAYHFGGTKIGKAWFKDCTSLKTLNLGNAGAIGESAFEGCTAITSVSFLRTSASALTLNPYAFKGCTGLTQVILCQQYRPITALPEGIFEGCTGLTQIVNGTNYNSSTGTYSITTLNGITSIGANAFNGCTALTRYGLTANKVTFANDLTTIGASAFAGCDAITNVVAPWETPIVITEDVFSATVYENATLDYPEASLDAYKAAIGWQKFFKDASAFTAEFDLLGTDGETVVGTMNIHIKTNETGGAMIYNDDVVAAQKLDGVAGILDLRVVKDGDDNTYPLVEIGKNAFKGVADITDVWLTANTLTTIGESAFENCENLVAFSSNASAASVINIGAYAFKGTPLYQMGNLLGKYQAATSTYSTVTTPLTIGDEAFKGTQIRFVVNGTNIRQLGEGVFEDCSMLKNNSDSVLYLSALTAVPARTFKNCSNLVHVNTGSNKCTEIGESAFEDCTSLSKVAMDGYTTSAGYVRLSDKLTAIGANAFKGCAAIQYVIINNMEAPTLGEDAFAGIKSNATFYLYPNNSYAKASNYAKNDSWKVFFDGTKASYSLRAYVNKTKQYGTVSCDVPLTFAYATTPKLYKVVAADDSYSYLEAVSSRKLPANTGAVIEVGTQTSGDNAGQLYTSLNVRVLFDGSASEADFEDNQLVANVTENTNFKGQEGDTYNLLLSNGKFVKATDGTLAGGLAYLPRTFEGGEAKELSLTTDEPTGIKTIDNGEPTVDNGAWYTIDGKRLQAEPTTKGIYVRGGKKIVVK